MQALSIPYRKERQAVSYNLSLSLSPISPKCYGPQITLLSLIAPLSHPSFYKIFPVCINPQSTLLVTRWDAPPFMDCIIGPIQSSNSLCWILFFTPEPSRHYAKILLHLLCICIKLIEDFFLLNI